MRPGLPWLAYGCLALSTSLVGSYVGLSKLLLLSFPVFLLAWLRFGLAAVLMLGWLRRRADEPPLDGHTRGLLFLESLLGSFLFSICLLYGLRQSSAVVAAIVMAGIPAAVALLSRIFLGEQLRPRSLAGIALSVAGIAWIGLARVDASAGAALAQPPSSGLGVLLLLAAVFCEACYVVIGKRLTQDLPPRRISALINLWGLLLVTPLGLRQALDFDFAAVSTSAWLLLLFYAAAASMITAWLWMAGLRRVPAAQAGVFMVFLPMATTAVGVLVLGESLSAGLLPAMLLALAGVLMATWPEARPQPRLP